ncbi:TetR/AcrR family transcriptional regulator [Novosphingobium mangrovi (ex Huang et al. 2023)]|uniref:TetR/AcrR family transcriptional regulator n=1 Tax=Novosphingobium mangrovi (ex Huang et al. 2023) TaxID=2976432 RepID=A0ABT2IA63_9SPHN|nr:TetR/AcrR family transcriptional regulator [Novosphingobium mangrovi (ex Huang et al. 2023)]MCT2401708.1 TetR/AcrR family transcriptional regulator [Novosphingobium mangrovi (ex Huang et al. 2023)]
MSKVQEQPAAREKPPRRRNKAFDETHTALIETAVRLVSEKGMEALSLSEVAREAGVNRTTIYYHFDSREALVEAVRTWSARQLAAAFAPDRSREDRTRYIVRFVIENPEVIGLWAEEFLSPGSIADRYPEWEGLVAGMREQLASRPETAGIDAEAYCTLMLTWAMLGPRVYRNSVRSDLPKEEAIERMTQAQIGLLRLHGIESV